jgi:C4-dicarboxylate-binding protein DctP
MTEVLNCSTRRTLEEAMKDATKYANNIAKKENDAALEAVKKSGKTQIITLTPQKLELGRISPIS